MSKQFAEMSQPRTARIILKSDCSRCIHRESSPMAGTKLSGWWCSLFQERIDKCKCFQKEKYKNV